jgi:hypothetical protein
MFHSDRCGNGANYMSDTGRAVMVKNGGGMSVLLVEGYLRLNWQFSTAVARQDGNMKECGGQMDEWLEDFTE